MPAPATRSRSPGTSARPTCSTGRSRTLPRATPSATSWTTQHSSTPSRADVSRPRPGCDHRPSMLRQVPLRVTQEVEPRAARIAEPQRFEPAVVLLAVRMLAVLRGEVARVRAADDHLVRDPGPHSVDHWLHAFWLKR